MYEIWIRDRYLERIGAISHFTKLELNMRFNDAGKWILELPIEATDAINLIIEARRQGGGIGGIIVSRDGHIIFSGPIRNIEMAEEWTGSGEGKFVAYGIDDTGLLATRLAMPPNQAGRYRPGAGTGIGYDVFTGPVESALIHLVLKNGGAEAEDGREIYLLATNPDEGRGPVVTVRSRYDNLLEKLKEVALLGGLGFRVVQEFDDFFGINLLVFQIYQPQDVTREVVFSKARRNLAGYRYYVEAPEANFIIVGGGGEETDRYFAYTADEPSRVLYGTIESFLDQRHTTDQAELLQALYAELEERTEKTELEIKPLDAEGTQFSKDYRLGDKATVEVQGEKIHDVIRAIDLVITPDGENVTPIVGTPGVGTSFRLFDDFRRLQGRVGKIERR